jgi:calpain-7
LTKVPSREDIDLDDIWHQIKLAFDVGDVMVTLGTGRLASLEEESLGLVGEHDYAVLELDVTAGTRRLLVKNPWCDGLVWKGLGSSSLKETQLPESLACSKPASVPNTQNTTGTFWISIEDVAQNFESMYLNWNPALFSHRQDHHFSWEVPNLDMASSLAHNPQYSLVPENDGEIWILLSRHFADAELDIAKARAASLAAVSKRLGFMSISIFENRGKRVQVRSGYIYQGPYVDSPQNLAKYQVKKGRPYTVVLAYQDLPLPNYTLTFSFFSQAPLVIKTAEENMTYHRELTGAWTRRTAGGNAASPEYYLNPQFSITVSHATPLSILLSTRNPDVPVHVDVVWAYGHRVNSITLKDIVGSSGDYCRGCAIAEIPSADAGTFTVVCSTFEAGQLGDFCLRVGSMVPCIIQPIKAEAAGRLCTPLPQLESGFREKLRLSIGVDRLTKVSVVARHTTRSFAEQRGQASAASVRISIVKGRGPQERVLAVSGGGEFRDLAMGLRTTECDIDPVLGSDGGLWVVIEQMSIQRGCSTVEVEMLTDGPVQIGGWEPTDM